MRLRLVPGNMIAPGKSDNLANAANGQLAAPANMALPGVTTAQPGSAGDSGGEVASLPPSPPVTVDMIQAAPSYQERALLTQNFVKQNPDHAALVVKELLKESDSLEKADG